MRLTLPDGSQIQLSDAMVQALRGTESVTGARDRSFLDAGVPIAIARALQQRGLVTPSPGGPWLMTAAGLEVVDALEAEHGADEGPSEDLLTQDGASALRIQKGKGPVPHRATVHPEVSEESADDLQWALDEAAKSPLAPTWVPDEPLGGRVGQLALVGILVFLFALMAVASWELAAFLGGVTGLFIWSLYGRYVLARDRALIELELNPYHILEDHKGLYTTGEALGDQARGMLGRAQAAVDSVLDSSLHREGLLLDETRNRVVLTDVEWSLARDLYSQAPTRNRIENTPAVGERSRQAAARARAVLAEDVARVEARIRTLESYADRVRAAELEAQDREVAAELDAIADHAELVGAVRSEHDESLSALVQAQQLALEVAAFSDGRESQGPVQ